MGVVVATDAGHPVSAAGLTFHKIQSRYESSSDVQLDLVSVPRFSNCVLLVCTCVAK